MAEFDEDTRMVSLGNGRYQGEVGSGWNISGNPNGGYLLSLVSAAIAQEVEHPDPLSFTAHYLRPGTSDEACDVSLDVVRQGRTLTNVRASLVQQGKVRLEVMAAYGDLSKVVGVDSDISLAPPQLPPQDQCIARTGDLQGIDIPMTRRLDVLLDPSQASPGQAGKAEISGWIRFADGRDIDTRGLLLFCDTFPPSPFGLLGVVGWVPTIELTVHIRRRPQPGWIVGRFQTDDLKDGRMIETGALWDSAGHLVAQCRQIGLVMQRD